MSLYIRVQNNFWNHRKTVRLKAKIGNDALWIMPRLWSYASENQPDGNFSDYASEELAGLIGCSKHATSIKQALIDVGFMDINGCLHDWPEHNGFHFNFAERAKKAATARWKSKGKEKTRDEMKRNETSIASGMLVASCSHDWSLEDCKKAAISIAMKDEDIQAFYNNYAAVGWIDATGRRITNLSAALGKWKANQPSHGRKYNSNGITNPERLVDDPLIADYARQAVTMIKSKIKVGQFYHSIADKIGGVKLLKVKREVARILNNKEGQL